MLSDIIVGQNENKFNPLKIIPNNPSTNAPPDVAAWIRFIREMRLPKIFSGLSDGRQPGKVNYSISSLALWAFSACAFRLGSKNALQTSLENLSSSQRQGMINLLRIEGDKLPHSSTVDNALERIPIEEFNQIPLHLVKQMEKRKFFYNHQELLPNNALQIACDGFWVHAYDHPHATHDDGTNACPYCLPRTYCKGTDKEKTRWIHVMVTFVLICEGLTLPLYTYPLKRGQINPEQPDDKLKEECELRATQEVLPMIREKFPRASIIFLGDALYANRPMVRLLNLLKMDYVIVLKEVPLKKLNANCDQLAKTEIYQRHYTRKFEEASKQGRLQKQAAWFNHADAGEGVFTNVLRYQEVVLREDGSSKQGYKGAWICSKKITMENCFKRAQIGRMRWKHEDLHNTAKNRGFDMKHDMARANPHLLLVWKMINFIAYFVFELFQHSVVARIARQSRSLKKFARDMLQQLINMSWSLIYQSPLLSKPSVQFRYQFDPP